MDLSLKKTGKSNTRLDSWEQLDTQANSINLVNKGIQYLNFTDSYKDLTGVTV